MERTEPILRVSLPQETLLMIHARKSSPGVPPAPWCFDGRQATSFPGCSILVEGGLRRRPRLSLTELSMMPEFHGPLALPPRRGFAVQERLYSKPTISARSRREAQISRYLAIAHSASEARSERSERRRV